MPWLLSVYAGRVDIEDGQTRHSKAGKRANGLTTGVPNSEGVNKGGIIMMITSISYLLLQVPANYYQSYGDTQEEVAAGEKFFAGCGASCLIATSLTIIR